VADSSEHHILVRGTLGAEGGRSVIRIELVVPAASGEVWDAVTQPHRLAAWYGTVEGDLRGGGTYHAVLFPSGWDGAGRVLECEPGRRFLVESAEPGHEPATDELELEPVSADATRVVLTKHGPPLEMIAAYGTGTQLHLENLRAYLAGLGPVDPDPYWTALLPEYERLAAAL
jgi:uncharacterized protein YndB with AHSA1/START domain